MVKNGERGGYMEINEILRRLTAEEKAALVAGTDFMFTNPV